MYEESRDIKNLWLDKKKNLFLYYHFIDIIMRNMSQNNINFSGVIKKNATEMANQLDLFI
jgi:hypothetical protein